MNNSLVSGFSATCTRGKSASLYDKTSERKIDLGENKYLFGVYRLK